MRGDTYQDDNFGDDDDLIVKSASSDFYTRRAYLRFDLGGFASSMTDSALFTAHVHDHQTPGVPVPLKLYSVSSDSWGENTLTWNNEPLAGALLGTIHVSDVGPVTFDITTYVESELAGDKKVSLVLLDDSGTKQMLKLRSRTRENDPPSLAVLPALSDCTPSGSIPIAPTAGFTVGTADLTANFTDTSTDSDGFITAWSWTFGDGNSRSVQNPSHTYTTAGTYTVGLTVTDNDGETDVTSVQVSVSAPPAFTDNLAVADILGSGVVSGTYAETHADDGSAQSVTERQSGGKKKNRYSYLVHTWQFDLPVNSMATLYANSWSGGSNDDDFVLSWSTNNASYFDLFTVSSTDSANLQSAIIPNNVSGTVHIRVKDTDQTAGNLSLDTFFVDHLFIRTDSGPGDPPAAPTLLVASAAGSDQADLVWTDNATNEAGFRVERSADGSSFSEVGITGADGSAFLDTGLAASTTYWYRVYALNGSGSSAYSNTDSITTEAASAITLSLSGYKSKGRHVVDLTWSGATSANVDIFRDGSLVATVPDSGAYTDPIGEKGAHTYAYQVCEAGTATCSAVESVTF